MSPATVAHEALVRRLRDAGCVFAEDEAALLRAQASSPAELERLVTRRVAGDPLEHVLGWVEFGGMRIAVERGVFVPRQRTVALAERAASLAGDLAFRRGRPAVVVDLCCGCGAIAAVIADRLARHGVAAEFHAADVDPAAVACAARTLTPIGGQVYHGDLYDALPRSLRGTVDVVVANVPYVPTSAVALMPPEAREHEPAGALDGGDDGLTVARRLVDEAPSWLSPDGSVLFECDETQAEAALAAVRTAGLHGHVHTDDGLGTTVITGHTRP